MSTGLGNRFNKQKRESKGKIAGKGKKRKGRKRRSDHYKSKQDDIMVEEDGIVHGELENEREIQLKRHGRLRNIKRDVYKSIEVMKQMKKSSKKKKKTFKFANFINKLSFISKNRRQPIRGIQRRLAQHGVINVHVDKVTKYEVKVILLLIIVQYISILFGVSSQAIKETED